MVTKPSDECNVTLWFGNRLWETRESIFLWYSRVSICTILTHPIASEHSSWKIPHTRPFQLSNLFPLPAFRYTEAHTHTHSLCWISSTKLANTLSHTTQRNLCKLHHTNSCGLCAVASFASIWLIPFKSFAVHSQARDVIRCRLSDDDNDDDDGHCADGPDDMRHCRTVNVIAGIKITARHRPRLVCVSGNTHRHSLNEQQPCTCITIHFRASHSTLSKRSLLEEHKLLDNDRKCRRKTCAGLLRCCCCCCST